jgi:hypothetical protein
MIGAPHAAASNSLTLGLHPAFTMSARVMFNVHFRLGVEVRKLARGEMRDMRDVAGPGDVIGKLR